ncbi:MAG: hypothetical protein ACI9CQ_004323 [Saprospiraceae bacterium]|jgi:hypothetical protein
MSELSHLTARSESSFKRDFTRYIQFKGDTMIWVAFFYTKNIKFCNTFLLPVSKYYTKNNPYKKSIQNWYIQIIGFNLQSKLNNFRFFVKRFPDRNNLIQKAQNKCTLISL